MAVSGDGRGRKRSDTAELSERLAPLEEQLAGDEGEGHQPLKHARPEGGDDTIRVDTAALKLPNKLDEDERRGADIFRLDPVVRVILFLMLAFIAFIAWQITRIPPAAK